MPCDRALVFCVVAMPGRTSSTGLALLESSVSVTSPPAPDTVESGPTDIDTSSSESPPLPRFGRAALRGKRKSCWHGMRLRVSKRVATASAHALVRRESRHATAP